ncbi:nucleotidyltransferase family protein [Anaeropeptidivorans aminofermentans]|uniref:nucleotidyltransferase family protein n=1 Tax=Anaeropeptidivorans aminofermentans TaxID=2934315 RepID=UPI0020258AC2|nr:nucleotidyltransferase family protein [Anaeropeptidivorans aminofermentans]
MDIAHKLEVLKKIAREFNNKGINWAVGASLLLYFKGISDTFNDIDILVSEKDVDKVKEILLPLGEGKERIPNDEYKTKYFLEYIIDGVEFDIMAGFIIVFGGEDYYFPIEEANIEDFTLLNGIKIPLQSVSEWRNYYYLMGRTKKVKMIDEYNKSN